MIDPSAPVANLFSRAQEGVARGDWKFAVDCLQRIIDDPDDSLVPRPAVAGEEYFVYESARARAMRRLASLPPEGLRAYRLLYDGKAKRLYELAERTRDPQHLRTIVGRFLLTRVGDDAADLLASWALDEGRLDEAITVLTDLREFVPDSDVPAELVVAKLAAAYAMIGRTTEAETLAEEFKELANGHPSVGRADSLGGRPDLAGALLALPPASASLERAASTWPIAGGSTMRRGRMPLVEPTLTDCLPWEFELLDRSPDGWRRVFFDDSDGPLSFPATQLVIDGDHLFVPTRLGCVALDADDLSLVWRSPLFDLGHGAAGLAAHRALLPPRRALSRQLSAHEDHVVGVASVAHGLVLVISREGRARYTQGSRDVVEDDSPGVAPGAGVTRGRISGTQLVALDARTGKIRWTRGRTAQVVDPLDGVIFHSVPIAVGGVLWVPCSLNGDLSAVVLDPLDGALLHKVSLGSVLGRASQSGILLPPAAGSGLVFIPSPEGALFCIDAHDYTVRWAGVYEIDELFDAAEPNTRIPSPPVVAGGLVLLVPPNSSQLLAFSITSGRVVWSTPCEESSYVIAADDQRIWLGGWSVECLAIGNGQSLWSSKLASAPTGRAVLSDHLVYVPTLDGLHSLRAESGEHLGYASIPGGIGEHGPLGNLLCANNAMFSVNASWIRRYPDVQRGYRRTVSRYEADPTDPGNSLHLGWLELLRGKPEEALRVLDAIEPTALEGDDGRDIEVAHARVEAILAMAEQAAKPPLPDSQRLDLLRRARQIARTAPDRLRCGLQIAHLLRSMGQLTEAYRTLWDTGVGADANQIVSLAPQVAGLARVLVARKLAEIREALSDEPLLEAAEYALSDVKRAESALEGPDSAAARRRLEGALELDPLGPAGQLARLTLTEQAAVQKRFERAEQLLRSCGRLDTQPAMAGSALMRLCRLFQEQGDDVSALHVACLNELERRFGDHFVTDEWQIRGILNEGAASQAVGDWIADMRADLPSDGYSSGVRGSSIGESGSLMEQMVLSGDMAWTLDVGSDDPLDIAPLWRGVDEVGEALAAADQAGPPRAVHVARPAASVLGHCVVFHAPGDVVFCLRASDGEFLWHTTLRLPDRLNVEIRERLDQWVDMPRRAIADGQTAVFNGADGLFAVGLVTGRRIWARPHKGLDGSDGPARSDRAMAARDGFLAATPRPGRLTLMRMLDGSTVWERDLRGERVSNVWMAADRVWTADPFLERVHLFRRSDGELIRRVLFKQPDPEVRLIEVVHTDDSLCGPVSIGDSDGLLAMDLTSGKTLWEARLDKPLYALFTPKAGYLGVGLLGGDIRILDASTGDVIMDRRVAGAHAVSDGALLNGTLLVEYLTLRGGLRYYELAALDVATGLEVWRREDVFPLGLPSEPLPVLGGRVPVALRPERHHPHRPPPVRVTMLDVRTGLNAGEELVLPPSQTRATLNGDLLILPRAGVVVIGLHSQIQALRVENATSSRQDQEAPTEGA